MKTRTRPLAPQRQPAAASFAERRRDELLDAATEVFAERGYHAATIREICRRAGANIASINYHFGDKLALYTEVLRCAAGAAGHDAARAILRAGVPPERALRAVIRAMVEGLYGRDRPTVSFRLMRHELVQPTPALMHVIDEVVRPNYDRLRATVGAMMGLAPDHETTRLCVHSIMGQILFYPQAGPVLAKLWPQMKMTPQRLDQIAEHIADFSLSYIQRAGARP